MGDWIATLEDAIRGAKREGTIEKREDAAQLAFELESFLFLANTQFALSGSAEPVKAGRRAIDRRLKEAAA